MSFLSFLTAPLNAIGNIATSAINAKSVRDTNEANFELAKWQQAQNERMWHMNNEYNNPSNQMSRLTEAGLNPNLVYGNGVTGNSSSQAAGPSLPTMSAYQAPQNMLGGLSDMFDAALKVANINKTEQEAKNLETTQLLTQYQAEQQRLMIDMQGYINAKTKEEAASWKRKVELDIALANAKVQREWSEFDLNTTREADLKSQTSFRDGVQTALSHSQIALNGANVGLAHANTALSNEKRISTIAERGLIQWEIENKKAQINNLFAQNNQIWESLRLSQSQREKIAHDISLIDANLSKVEIEREIRQILINEGCDLNNSGVWSLIDKGAYIVGGKLDKLSDTVKGWFK